MEIDLMQLTFEAKAPGDSWPYWKRVFWAMLGDAPFQVFLDTCNQDQDQFGQYEALAGAASEALAPDWEGNRDLGSRGKWAFGLLPYELKSVFEPGVERLSPLIEWPETAFFSPDWVAAIDRQNEMVHIWGWVGPLPDPVEEAEFISPAPVFSSNFTRARYLDTVAKIRENILDGEYYEINLSQVFSARVELSSPRAVFQKLTGISPTPFASFFRFGDRYIMAASPERFLQKKGALLTTQPIKGTTRRGVSPAEDQALMDTLRHSEKEQAENVMIVDLSRNDLHRVCKPGTVRTPYLFEVQTFKQVHQLVSTVVGELEPDMDFGEIMPRIFPPGSMTGAPKIRTMEWINTWEGQGRGAYSGSVGYIDPAGDFDFNVVIRGLVYDHANHQLMYQVGGAITADSDAAREYEETLLKARAIRGVMD